MWEVFLIGRKTSSLNVGQIYSAVFTAAKIFLELQNQFDLKCIKFTHLSHFVDHIIYS